MTTKPRPKLKGKRKRKPKRIAVIQDSCTGCSGSPVCQEYCPTEKCMVLVTDEDNPTFQVMTVDPLKCMGCTKCMSKGPDGTFLDGCPWDAIEMMLTKDYEAEHGELPY